MPFVLGINDSNLGMNASCLLLTIPGNNSANAQNNASALFGD